MDNLVEVLGTTLLDEIEDFLDDYADVRDESYGEQEPNRAMSLLSELRHARGKAE